MGMRHKILILLCLLTCLVLMVCGAYFPMVLLWIEIGLRWNWLANLAVWLFSILLVTFIICAMCKLAGRLERE